MPAASGFGGPASRSSCSGRGEVPVAAAASNASLFDAKDWFSDPPRDTPT